MKNIPNNTQSILQDMRKITLLTGEISNIHLKSLTTWPYVVFDDVKNVEIKYDLSKSFKLDQGFNLIEFFIFFNNDRQSIDKFEKRCETLERWIESMLWSEIKIKVYINDILEYSTISEIENESEQN